MTLYDPRLGSMSDFFSSKEIITWERSDCINFAIALARYSGWLLHIDWLAEGDQGPPNRSEKEMIPLRFYVGDHSDNIFDARGIMKIEEFCQEIISPIAEQKYKRSHFFGNPCGVATRFYSEEKLRALHLQMKPSEMRIKEAIQAIRRNKAFLEKVPIREKPFIPAYAAANFTFGRCAVYAEALQNLVGIPATALLATKFMPMYERTERSPEGYIHSLVLHSGSTGEDVWGKQPVTEIARRFGALEFRLDENEHKRVIKNLKNNSPDTYNESYCEAESLIKTYRCS